MFFIFLHCFFIIPNDFIRCKNVSLFQRLNMESRKSPKLSRANQEGQRSPRLPTKKPPVRSPSLTRREFSMDGITEVMTCQIQCTAKYYSSCSLASNTVVPALLSLCNSQHLMLQYVLFYWAAIFLLDPLMIGKLTVYYRKDMSLIYDTVIITAIVEILTLNYKKRKIFVYLGQHRPVIPVALQQEGSKFKSIIWPWPFCVCMLWALSRYSGFLLKSKDMHLAGLD